MKHQPKTDLRIDQRRWSWCSSRSKLSTITKSDLTIAFRTIANDTVLAGFSLLLPLRLRVCVVNGETMSRSLDVSTSMFMAERAACERLADLPVVRPVTALVVDWVGV